MAALYHDVQQLSLFTLTRFCPARKTEKSFEHFSKDKQRRDGLCCYCRPCASKRVYRSEKANPHLLKKMYATRRQHGEYDKKYAQTHRIQRAEWQRRRDAVKRGATIGKVDYDLILEQYGRHCHICDKPIEVHQKLHFDHVVPLNQGGQHAQENILPSHETCNTRKKDKLMSELTDHDRRGPS